MLMDHVMLTAVCSYISNPGPTSGCYMDLYTKGLTKPSFLKSQVMYLILKTKITINFLFNLNCLAYKKWD